MIIMTVLPLISIISIFSQTASFVLRPNLVFCTESKHIDNPRRIAHPGARSLCPSNRSGITLAMASQTNTNELKHAPEDNNRDDGTLEPSSWKISLEANPSQKSLAKSLNLWPLDTHNVELLNEVHPWKYENPTPLEEYDLVVIGAGAGGLVSSRQAARRGAKSCMISMELAGGDCLNAGCVPSKALLRSAKLIREARKAASKGNEYGVELVAKRSAGAKGASGASGAEEAKEAKEAEVEVKVNFPQIMKRMRSLRAAIAPIDGHARGNEIGTQVFQGQGVFRSPNSVEVIPHGGKEGDESNPILKFKKCVIATGGRPTIPTITEKTGEAKEIPGLESSPYLTNLNLFNLQSLPPRMVILGAGIVALEMAQAFATFGSQVTVLSRSKLLSKGDEEAGEVIKLTLKKEGVEFLSGVQVKRVETLRDDAAGVENGEAGDDALPLMRVSLTCNEHPESTALECECLLIATGRTANVENMNLDLANVKYHPTQGILVNNYAQSISNPNVYSVGDCTAHVPRLTHMSGEMAKVVVQNALFNGRWELSSLVVPAVMYTEPEYAVVSKVIHLDDKGHVVASPKTKKMDEDMVSYKVELKHNDRAILDSSDSLGHVKISADKSTGKISSCTILSTRAGEMVNEVSLAIKYEITMEGLGRNIHSYPTLGEGVMGCGLQWINERWVTM